MFALLVLLAVSGSATAAAPRVSTRGYKHHTFTFPTPQISDDQLVINDLSAFVHGHSLGDAEVGSGAGPPAGNGTALRIKPVYIEKDIPRLYHEKLFRVMKQALYAAQDRLKYLDRLLEKYKDDVSFRAGFIFTKLDQSLEDMRRIYSYAAKQREHKRIIHNIIFFRHLAKKNIDVTYIVEFLYTYHQANLDNLEKLYSGIL